MHCICALFSVLACLLFGVSAFSKPGLWENVPFDQDKGYLWFTKSMYQDTIVTLKIDCSPVVQPSIIKVEWLLRYTQCMQEFEGIELKTEEQRAVELMMEPGPHQLLYAQFGYDTLEYINDTVVETCNGHIFRLPDKTGSKPYIENVEKNKKSRPNADSPADVEHTTEAPKTNKNTEDKKKEGTSRRRRDTTSNPDPSEDKPAGSDTEAGSLRDSGSDTEPATDVPLQKPNVNNLAKVWKSGYYVFIVRMSSEEKFSAKVTVSMKGKVGYISAVDWPLLIFYGVMGLVYIIYGLIWLVMLACNWRDLMRLHYWIGAVIVLGMLEKAVFYAVYQTVAKNGRSVTRGTVIFAEIVSALKRALARMLVIIVSVGYSSVKPRLGPTFHKVLFVVVGLYFILGAIEGSMRSLKPKLNQSQDQILAAVPLLVLDASIYGFIFAKLVKTTRELRLRKSIVKLTLYRYFFYTIIFALLAHIIFTIWSIIQINMKTCIKEWQELWIDEAHWHLLFSIILAVIMILWRPSSSSQRYAFSPDAADEEDDETFLNDAFDGMKNISKQTNGSQNVIKDDLKLVVKIIPSTPSDKAQTLIESDDKEIMKRKYEMSEV